MEISGNEINKFQKIYKLQFGIDLTPDEAVMLANKLLGLLEQIYKPYPSSDTSDNGIK